MKRNSRQDEHQRHRDLKEHENLEIEKGDWYIGHRRGRETRAGGKGNNSIEFGHG